MSDRDKALQKFNDAYVNPVVVPDGADAAAQLLVDAQNQDNRRTSFNDALQGLLTESLPPGAGTTIKADIRTIRKPFEMSVGDFCIRLDKLNSYIGLCPGNERPYDDTELKTLLQEACPRSWQVDLKKQIGFNTMTYIQVKNYYKLLENVEGGSFQRQTQ